MTNEKGDRRARRTRQLLNDALFALILEKRYDKITIDDIVERADVGRSTFYAHFQDKDALLSDGLERLLAVLKQQAAEEHKIGTQLLSVCGLFRHVGEQHKLYEAMVWGHGIELFFKFAQESSNRDVEAHFAAQFDKQYKPKVSLSLVSNYVVGTLLTLLKWWLDNKMPYTPERMEEIFQQLVAPGIQTMLGKGAAA